MPVVPRVAKPFGSSLLESYWPEIEDPSNGLGSAVSFKIPAFRYVADRNEIFALARGWVITGMGRRRTPAKSGVAGLYVRYWARCLFISNMVTRFLPNTAWSFSSAIISRLFCGSWRLFFLM